MRRSLAVLLVFGLGTTCAKPRVPPVAPTQPFAAPSAPATQERGIGPLALSRPIPVVKASNQDRWIDKAGIDSDFKLFLSLTENLGAAGRAKDVALQRAQSFHRELMGQKGPFSAATLTKAIGSIAKDIGVCTRAPMGEATCFTAMQPHPASRADQPYELELVDGIAILRVHELSEQALPAWASLPEAWAGLEAPKGIVLDMRSAWGNDPTPLLGWISALAGIKTLKPLRAVHRPAIFSAYVDAYNQYYLNETRSGRVWSDLVARDQVTSPPTVATPPIAVVTGRFCESACELVARVLETYSGATVVGGVSPTGRLHRDEAALLRLPFLGSRLYFYASEYLLSADLEAKTGPSDNWTSVGGDMDFDGTAFALEEVSQRAKTGKAWPERCDAHASFDDWRRMPIAARPKLEGPHNLKHCSGPERSIQLYSKLPFTAVRNLLATCSTPVKIVDYSDEGFDLGSDLSIKTLTQAAQSTWVDSIEVTCTPMEALD